MHSIRLNLAEKFILLAMDDEKGRFFATNSISVGYGMAASILIVMALRREIGFDEEANVIVMERRSEEEVIRVTLDLIEAIPLKNPIQYWIRRIARNHLTNQQLIIGELCTKGILHQEETKLGKTFKIKKYPTVDPVPEMDLRVEIMDYIQDKEPLRPSLFFLLLLIQAGGIFDEVFSEKHRELAKKKLAEIKDARIPSGRLRQDTATILESIHLALKRLVS